MRTSTTFLFIVLLTVAATVAEAQLARQWVSRYAGTKSATDVATAIAIDDSGYACITGYAGRGSGYNIVTMRFNPDGVRQWIATYQGSGSAKGKAIAVDSGGACYVLASIDSGGSTNYLTIKYSRTGVTEWMRMYNGPANGEDVPVAIAVNDSLNVFVTGSSAGSGTGLDFATLKYNASGTLQWEKRFNGRLSSEDKPCGLALSGNSTLIVGGSVTDTGKDYGVIKYSPTTGDSVWFVSYNGPAGGDDIAVAVVLGSSSNVYITGSSQGSGTGYDYATVKYNSSGEKQWESRFDGALHGDDHPAAMAVYGTQRVYVTGRTLNVGSYYDMTTVAYNASNGDENWAESFDGAGSDDDVPVAVTAENNPYVIGGSTGIGTGMDYALLKYKGSNGELQWSSTYNSIGFGEDIPTGAALSGGSVFITGRSAGVKTGVDYLTVKYTDPKKLKYRTFTQAQLVGKGVSIKTSLVVPNFANARDAAYAAAFPKIKKGFAGAPGGMLIGNARPDSATAFGWIRVSKAAALTSMLPQTGTIRGFTSAEILGEKKDLKLAKYNNTLVGDLIGLKMSIAASDAEVTPPTLGDLVYNDEDTSNHYNGMTLRQLCAYVDNVLTYSTRYTGVNYTTLDTMITKVLNAFTGPIGVVSSIPVVLSGVTHIDSVEFLEPNAAPLLEPLQFEKGSIVEVPDQYTLYQNYPNPFNPSTTIEFDLPEETQVTLKIYDMVGREVATLLNGETMEEGRQQVMFDASSLASGVYFYRIVAGENQFQTIRKMVLLR